MPPQPGNETPGMALWLVLPLLTTIMLRAFAGDGWKDIALKPRLSSNTKWYVVSFVIFPFITAALLLIGWLMCWIDFSNFKTSDYLSVFAASLIPNFIKNIFEEFVWRGYLTSKLLQLKLNDWWLYLIVGTIWGAWHIPYYLFFLPEAQIAQILPVDRIVFAHHDFSRSGNIYFPCCRYFVNGFLPHSGPLAAKNKDGEYFRFESFSE